ncbi:neuroguidin-like, partial [Scyliorhinus torazame]|uniref:neuroguidin-like n=1 Tax=Scyliorhinus torazame TaxID=75743 RepID=UPI003B5A716A
MVSRRPANRLGTDPLVHPPSFPFPCFPQLSAVSAHVGNVVRHIRSGELPTDKGLSFLEVKNQMLAMYLSDLAHVIRNKITGTSLRAEPAVLRLVEIRTVLEKMRATDQKLRYQIDKLVKTALTGTLGADNPLTFKPNPGNMISQIEEDEVDSEEGEGDPLRKKESGLKSKKIYIPPRLVPMHY